MIIALGHSKMTLLDRWRASFLYGKGLKLFERKKFRQALTVFKKLEKIERNLDLDDGKELTLYYLGMSYSSVGDKNKSIVILSKAYPIFKKRVERLKSTENVYYFKVLTAEYIKLLDETEQRYLAKKISLERKKLLEWDGGKEVTH